MAVDSKNKNSNIKKKETPQKEKTNDIKKKGNTIPKEDTTTIKKDHTLLILILTSIALIVMIILMIPYIKLLGNPQITITYNDTYQEEGYKAKWLFKDISKDIKVTSDLNVAKIGIYHINYNFKYGIFNLNKYRIVKVIDDVVPEIETESDTINICPNEAVPEIKYLATDEYDGELTDKVQVSYEEEKILLEVSDNSNNKTSKEVVIDRVDKTGPEITLKGNKTIYLSLGNTYYEPGYTAKDKCDGDLTDKVKVSGSVGSGVGDYTITYSVTDNSENKTEVTRTVIVRNYNLYNSGSIGNGIYLTFDDGPQEGTTNVILDILKEEGIKATFFVTCNGPDYLIKRMYDEGHTVALHTCHHDYSYVYSSTDNYFNDLNSVKNRVKNITGIDAKIIRFPGGSSNTVSRNYSYGIMSTLTNMVLDNGYRYFDWNVDSNDAGGANSSSQVYNNVVSHLSHDRANVVLMHDIKYQTRDALRDIITYAKSEGYLFGKLENDTYMIRHSVNN